MLTQSDILNLALWAFVFAGSLALMVTARRKKPVSNRVECDAKMAAHRIAVSESHDEAFFIGVTLGMAICKAARN